MLVFFFPQTFLLPRNNFWQFMDKSDLFLFWVCPGVEKYLFFLVLFLLVELVAWNSLFPEACCEVAILLVYFLFRFFRENSILVPD